ncbi:P450 reductase 2 [Striga asiatica]|uniref:P450 reductase 2 n=1 Tax=Striga asiatica TaxID=4170 RepID=A0A5A7QBH2_STRAF|nr:P450 reductase 2 [Striga asiatica]
MSPEIEGRQLSLPKPLHTASPRTDSLLYDVVSRSLALRHSDSSFSLYPSFSPLSFPSPHVLVPSPTSSAAFLHLRNSSDPAVTLFLASTPVPSAVLLRFYILRAGRFARIRVVSSHRDLEFDPARWGAVFRASHGVSVKLSGGANVFSMYSVSSSKIWVFAVRLIGDEGGGEALKLIKCAVVNCWFPVCTVRVLFGFLVLGEENGVRVFPLRPLIKGNQRKEKKNGGKRNSSKNGLSNGVDVAKSSNGGKALGQGGDKHSESVKSRSVKLRQDSKDVGSFFVAFEDKNVGDSISTEKARRSIKAISIQALSTEHFVVLDSIGNVHLLSLSFSIQGMNEPRFMKRLNRTMKVQKLAVFEDVSSVTRNIWISDGCHSVHLMTVSDTDTSFDNSETKDTEGKILRTSGPTILHTFLVTQAIFTSEKIQEIVPLAANAVLILGQGISILFKFSPSFLGWTDGTCHFRIQKYVCLCNFIDLLDVLFEIGHILIWRINIHSQVNWFVNRVLDRNV